MDGKDFAGELIAAARAGGLAVVARMDSNQATEELLRDQPDWFFRDRSGNPVRASRGRFYTCINTGYYTKQLAGMIREVYDRYHPDAFADNSWFGKAASICYCEACQKKFREDTGLPLPVQPDFQDLTYRKWLDWNRKLRTELYDWFNKLSTSLGGPDCVYMGMLHPDAYNKNAADDVMDYVEYSQHNKAVFIDGQIRLNATGFDANTLQGLATHEIFGDDTLVIESVATYHLGPNFMRRAANTRGETASWMRSGMLGGISPSLHYIGGVQEDRRILKQGLDIMAWDVQQEEYLYNRRQIANVGLLRSFKNMYFYGQDKCTPRIIQPMDGMVNALKRGRISYRPLDVRQLKNRRSDLDLIILPDIAVLSDEEMEDIISFIKQGGSILYTGATGMLDEWGNKRPDFPLDALFDIQRTEKTPLNTDFTTGFFMDFTEYNAHNYMRIQDHSHPIFQGFDETNLIELHGIHYHVVSNRLTALATMVPAFPVYPPETAYMADGEHDSGEAAILAGDTGFGGRVVYFSADVDRRNGQIFFPDLGNLLKNSILWALKKPAPFTVDGPGELSCVLYEQEKQHRKILQLVNHSGLSRWPGSVEEYYPVGPEQVSVRTTGKVQSVVLKNLNQQVEFKQEAETLSFVIPSVYDQELAVIQYEP